jgi:hypothetical protein
VDCAGVEWWRFDQFVLGDVFAWFVHVYERNNLVHGDGSDQWHFVPVQCDGDECVRNWFGFDGVIGGCSVDGSWCSDFGFGDQYCERIVGCVVVGAVEYRWCCDQFVQSDGVGCLWDFDDESVGSVGR